MKLSQFQVNFLLLLTTPKGEWIAVHDFGRGDVEILGKHYFMSYKNPARCSDVYYDMPSVIERKWRKGKSGTKYRLYRLDPSQRQISTIERVLDGMVDSKRKAYKEVLRLIKPCK